jgi:threonine aldolase
MPTANMRMAMFQAEVGDDGRRGADGRGEDPSVNELEAYAAGLLGKEASLFVASGTMGNLLAALSACKRGDSIVVEENAHILRTEQGVFNEKLGGFHAVPVSSRYGVPRVDDVVRAARRDRVSLVCLENTHNYAGGTIVRPAELEAIRAAAGSSLPIHLDGARLFNAAAGLGVRPCEFTRHVDSVTVCLSKGLAAPAGSILAGTREFIRKATENRRLVGGQMRQIGFLAAAGLIALRGGIDRLAEDHRRARILAEGLSQISGIDIDMETVQTNIVKVSIRLPLNAQEFVEGLNGGGIRLKTISATQVRFVTHRDIADDDIEYAVKVVKRFCQDVGSARAIVARH